MGVTMLKHQQFPRIWQPEHNQENPETPIVSKQTINITEIENILDEKIKAPIPEQKCI
jgi:hypothetical protein